MFYPLYRNLDVNAGSQVELHKRVYCLWCWVNYVEKTLVRTDLKLVAGFFVYVWATQNSELLDFVRKRDRAANRRPCTFCCGNDFRSACIKHTVIKRLQADSDTFGFLRPCSSPLN